MKNLKTYESFNNDNFKNWFGDSKVVDSGGNPIVVYHGSPDVRQVKDTGVFLTTWQKYRDTPADEEGSFFFTSDISCARSYTDPKRAFDYQNCVEGVISVYLKIENPYIHNNKGQSWKGTRKLVDEVKAMHDYDGIIIKNTQDNYNNTDATRSTTVYVVFYPNQIKSSESNSGTYNIHSNSIFESMDEMTSEFYYLYGALIYVDDISTWGGDEYKVDMRKRDGNERVYIGTMKEILEDFKETDYSFEIKRLKEKDDNTYNIVYYIGNNKVETPKTNLEKKLAYALRGTLAKEPRYKTGTLEVEKNI